MSFAVSGLQKSQSPKTRDKMGQCGQGDLCFDGMTWSQYRRHVSLMMACFSLNDYLSVRQPWHFSWRL